MKILYYGGQKSGKSTLAEKKALELAGDNIPFYIATYDNGFGDEEMIQRVARHQDIRAGKFITIEELRDIKSVIKEGETYLVDCLSMWIMNMLQEDEGIILAQLESIAKIDANIIFVLNNVTEGVIPIDKVSRSFVDLTGIVGQKTAAICDEVYEVKLGLLQRLK